MDHHHRLLSLIIFANGIYDIICAFSIANIIPPPLIFTLASRLHLSMFKSPPNKMLLATWILINGIIRSVQYYYQSYISIRIVQLSYFVEAGVFTVELLQNNVIPEKAIFVITSSLLLGFFAK